MKKIFKLMGKGFSLIISLVASIGLIGGIFLLGSFMIITSKNLGKRS
jgi:hypothetical protein